MCECECARTLEAYRKTTFNHSYLSSSLFGDIVQPSNTYGGKNLLWVFGERVEDLQQWFHSHGKV